jgi:Fe-S-cluster containining protein
MTTPDLSAAASRLCADCGMCCNGVLFHTVRLQPADSAKALAALGLKLKRKQGQHYIQQPCPALKTSHCSIYTARPERCRLFECRQLQRVAAGELTEPMARDKIREARRLVAEVNSLLLHAGGTNLKHPLSKRWDKALAEPLDSAAPPTAWENRQQLTQSVLKLSALLDQDFRIIPTGPPAWAQAAPALTDLGESP